MPQQFDLYWSFRSPYSYLVTGRVVEFARTHDVDVRLRIVHPLAVRKPDYYAALPPQRRAYFRLDPPRVAEQLGISFGAPRPDPVVIDPATRRPAPEQPYIGRLSHLGVEAGERGRGLAFVHEVSRLVWGGSVDGWDRGDHLAAAARRAGLDLPAMDAAIAADPARYERILAGNQGDLEAAGHWGVPTFVFAGEPFFGQDRFDMLVRRLAQAGLRERHVDGDAPPVLVLDEARKRYELRRGDAVIGFSEFNRVGEDAVMLTHSEVDPAHEGEGHGSRLAREALEDIRRQGRRVIPMCPFIAAFIRRHPEYIELVRPDMRAALKI